MFWGKLKTQAVVQEQDFLVLIGTGEGAVYKCNTANRTGYLLAYEGHAMSVYSVRWNRVHPATFLTASADWTVKLWHSDNAQVIRHSHFCSTFHDLLVCKNVFSTRSSFLDKCSFLVPCLSAAPVMIAWHDFILGRKLNNALQLLDSSVPLECERRLTVLHR